MSAPTFTHVARAPDVDQRYPGQRWFTSPSGTVTVYRHGGDDHAELTVRHEVGRLRADLSPAELLDLARALIDAAADVGADMGAQA